MYESKIRGNKKIDSCYREACHICDLNVNCTKGMRTRLEKVRAEFSLTALVYKMGRALNLVGIEETIAAVRVCKDGFGNKFVKTLPPEVRTA